MKWNKRVYGVIGISSIMSNWNADFSHRPKTTINGDIFGSDKALKYPMKRMWENAGEKVLAIKSYIIPEATGAGKEKNKLQPRDLQERYEYIFGKIDKDTPSKEVLKNLFCAVDVMNFGTTFAVPGQNISITGAVQIGQGYNRYKDADIHTQDILSPYRNSNEKSEDNTTSSLGTKIVTDEAHYFYPFSVNPQNYRDYEKLGIEGFEGYSQEAYLLFKKAALISATAFNTNSKAGCENEFTLFIECKDDSEIYLPSLDEYIEFIKGKDEGKNTISLEWLGKLVENKRDDIDGIEIYYNSVTTELNIPQGMDVKIKNLY